MAGLAQGHIFLNYGLRQRMSKFTKYLSTIMKIEIICIGGKSQTSNKRAYSKDIDSPS